MSILLQLWVGLAVVSGIAIFIVLIAHTVIYHDRKKFNQQIHKDIKDSGK